MSIQAAEHPTHQHVALAPHPTLANVAALAGVSPATASRVLTGSARVSPTARKAFWRS